MKKIWIISALMAPAFAAGAQAQSLAQPAALILTSASFQDEKPIPTKFAYCKPNDTGRSTDADNISPQLSWSGAPSGTQSYVLIVVDPDVPASFELANQDGKTIPDNFPRQNFYHWVLVDIPPTITSLDEGQDSKGRTPGGKPIGKTTYGFEGQNDYARFNSGGAWGGYDGCCPPWNDERLHHYHFLVYALDVPTLGLTGTFGGQVVEKAIKDHVLAKGEIVGTYTNNAKLLAK